MSPQRLLQPSHPHPEQPARDGDGPDLLSQLDVCREFGISDQTWFNWRKRGWTPEPVVLPSGRKKWRREDIDAMTRKPKPRIVRAFATVRGVR